MSKRIRIFLLLGCVAVAIAFVALAGASNSAPSAPAPPVASLTVSVAPVQEVEWQETIVATGGIFPWQEAIIGAEISGPKLIDVLVDVGDVVKKGQILAKFDPDLIVTEQVELKANWIAATASQKRAQELESIRAVSKQSMEDAVNRTDVAKARLDAKTLQLKYTEVVAPDDGVISARTATLGAVAASGDELFRLIRQNRLEWRGELTAEQASRAVQGQKVTLTLPNGAQAQGVVCKLAPSFNEETRLATIFVDIQQGSGAMAGMYAKGEIALGVQTAIAVSAQSVVIRDGRDYVFALAEEEGSAVAHQRMVHVGARRDGQVRIISGLTAGERVVVNGSGFLKDKDHVRIAPESDAQQ